MLYGKVGKIFVAYILMVGAILVILQSYLLTVVSVGSAAKGEKESVDEHEHLDALKSALLRLPRVHLYVLDAIVLHLRESVFYFFFYAALTNYYRLIDNTKVEETDEVYVTKLALSIGRGEFFRYRRFVSD